MKIIIALLKEVNLPFINILVGAYTYFKIIWDTLRNNNSYSYSFKVTQSDMYGIIWLLNAKTTVSKKVRVRSYIICKAKQEIKHLNIESMRR